MVFIEFIIFIISLFFITLLTETVNLGISIIFNGFILFVLLLILGGLLLAYKEGL